MSGTPTWFGPAQRPLFGWVHLPADGCARGVAVFCNPIGREAANALPAVQAACDETAGVGIAALRFAYGGTGDSAGWLEDRRRVPDWVASVGHAVDFARTISPGPVVLVGMRVGALLATEAVSKGLRVDGLVLWDPSRSGRAFLRLEQTLLATGYAAPQSDDGSVRGPAFTYSPETAEDLSLLSLGPLGPQGPPTVVLGRSGDLATQRVRPDFEASGAEWVDVEGQPELLDVFPDLLVVPTTTTKTVAEGIDALVTGPSATVDFRPQPSAVLDVNGSTVREHPEWLGPNALFAMITEPDDGRRDATVGREYATAGPEDSPTLVFLSAGALDHTGPGRRWVEITRHFAAGGLRTVRVDQDGVGETHGRPNLPRNVPKPATAIDDVCDIAAALGDPDARRLVLVGLSSGGYNAIETALRLHPLAVCAMNPGIATKVPELVDGDVVDSRRRAYRPMPTTLRKLAKRHLRVARWINTALVQVVVRRSPHHSIAGVCRRGIPLLLVLTEEDSRQFERSPYWTAVRSRLARRGLLDLRIVPGFDHSLYTVSGQEHTYPILISWITERYVAPERAGEATAVR